MVYSSSERISEPLREPDPRRGTARLRIGGRAELLGSGGATLGRSRDADIVLDDAERVAQARRGPAVGRVVDRARPGLHQRRQGQRAAARSHRGRSRSSRGDVIELGTSRAIFELE